MELEVDKGFRQPIPTKRTELELQAIYVSHQSVHFPADVGATSSVPDGVFEHSHGNHGNGAASFSVSE